MPASSIEIIVTLVRIADLMTVAWKVYGISGITTSAWFRAASRAASSLTSREMALAFLKPEARAWALSRVRQAITASSAIIHCNRSSCNSIGHTDSDLNISLAENINSGLSDYQKPKISKCINSRSSMRGTMTRLGLGDLKERREAYRSPNPKGGPWNRRFA